VSKPVNANDEVVLEVGAVTVTVSGAVVGDTATVLGVAVVGTATVLGVAVVGTATVLGVAVVGTATTILGEVVVVAPGVVVVAPGGVVVVAPGVVVVVAPGVVVVVVVGGGTWPPPVPVPLWVHCAGQLTLMSMKNPASDAGSVRVKVGDDVCAAKDS
jgi:hypothetical protein